MDESPRGISKKRQAVLDEAVSRYLEGTRTTWEDLRCKSVLDIAVDDGAFADAARQQGIDVVSMDIRRREWNRFHRHAGEKQPFVQADAATLPFAEATFDVVISHAGPFDGRSDDVFREAYRVLKPGGELRVGRVPINPEGPIPDLPEDLDERMAAVRQHSQKYVVELSKKMGFSDVEYTEHPADANGMIYCSFVFRK